jgi:hypothetical protein
MRRKSTRIILQSYQLHRRRRPNIGLCSVTETKSSLDTKLHLTAEKVAAEALNKFLLFLRIIFPVKLSDSLSKHRNDRRAAHLERHAIAPDERCASGPN